MGKKARQKQPKIQIFQDSIHLIQDSFTCLDYRVKIHQQKPRRIPHSNIYLALPYKTICMSDTASSSQDQPYTYHPLIDQHSMANELPVEARHDTVSVWLLQLINLYK